MPNRENAETKKQKLKKQKAKRKKIPPVGSTGGTFCIQNQPFLLKTM